MTDTTEAVARLAIDEDGDAYLLPSGRENNLVALPAVDENNVPLHPEIFRQLVDRFNAYEVLTARVAELIHDLERLKESETDAINRAEASAARVKQLEAENALLRIALADAIRRPMGVVPASAEGFVSTAELDAAETRRPRLTQRDTTPSRDLASALADLAAKQEPLGPEFEAALGDRSALYESNEALQEISDIGQEMERQRARDEAIVRAAWERAAERAQRRWVLRMEHADRLYEMDYPEAKIDAKNVRAKADEAGGIAEEIRALADNRDEINAILLKAAGEEKE